MGDERDLVGIRGVPKADVGALAHGDWIATLGRHGFGVEALHEHYAPMGAVPAQYERVTPQWAQHRPVEEIWVTR